MQTKKISYLLLISLFMILQGRAQAPSYTLQGNESGSNKEYEARDYVRLQPGFSFSASSGNFFNARIDPNLDFTQPNNPDPGSFIFVNPPAQTSSVGSISGQFAVSPTGAASYSIPIEIPLGINGMQPNISLVYNSQIGNGIAGWGWNISGVSMISRVPRNHYYDGEKTGIIWDNTSPLALDGQRLIEIQRWSTDSVEYDTEAKSGNRIVGYNIKSWGAECFKVYTKSGQIMQYGSTQNLASYFPLTSTPDNLRNFKNLGWAITNIIDNNRNTVKFQYLHDVLQSGRGPYYLNNRIEKILYGGNLFKNKENDIRIEFEYNNIDTENTVTTYVNGQETTYNKILDKIKTYVGNSPTSTYSAQYNVFDSKHHLTGVTLSNSNNQNFSSSVFQWPVSEYTLSDDIEMNFDACPSYNDYCVNQGYSISRFDKMFGDINGDGLTDVIVKATYKKGNDFKYYWIAYKKIVGSNQFNYVYETMRYNKDDILILLDKDHDGKDELYECTYHYRRGSNSYSDYEIHFYRFYYENSTMKCLGSDGRTIFPEVKAYIPQELYDNRENAYILPADFKGNGEIDFIVVNNQNKIFGTHELTRGTDNITLAYSYLDIGGDQNSRILLTDINGNGKTEIMYIKDNTYNFYEYNNSTNQYSSININYGINYKDGIYTGDFNGDGNTDLLVQKVNTFENKIWLSNGVGLFQSTWGDNIVTNQKSITYYMNIDGATTGIVMNPTKQILDVNQDGKSDILSCYFSNDSSNAILKLYVSSGNGFVESLSEVQPQHVTHLQSSGKFGSINEKGIVSENFFNSVVFYRLAITTNKPFNKIENIVDVFGNQTNITYQPINIPKRNNVNIQKSLEENKSGLTSFIAPDYEVVTSVITPIETNQYSYHNPHIHWQGRGFLGFDSLRVDNMTNSVTIEKLSKINTDYYLLYPVTERSKKFNGSLIAESNTEYVISDAGNNKYTITTDKQTSTDHLSGLTAETKYLEYDNWLNPKEIKTTKGGLIETQTISYIQKGAWCPNKPDIITTTTTYNGDSITHKTDFDYDTKGNLISETTNPDDTKYKTVTEYANFDSFGHAETISFKAKDKLGTEYTRTSHVKHKESGRFVDYKINVLGEKTTYSWDETLGLLSFETTTNAGNSWSKTTVYGYDSWGRLTETVYPDGIRKKEKLFWANGSGPSAAVYYSLAQATGGAPVTVWFDALGREIQKDTYGLNNKKILVSTEYYTSGTNKGRLYRVSEPYFENDTRTWAETYQEYDEYGRIKKVVTPMGETNTVYSPGSTTVTTPEGSSTTTLNSSGFVATSTVNEKTVSYTYYPNGLTKTSTPQGGEPISMEYNQQGKRTKLTDPDAGIVETVYNGFGELEEEKQLIHKDNPNKIVTTNNYDYSTGLLTTINRNGEIISYIYDVDLGYKGRVKSISIDNDRHKQTFTYDGMNRVTNVEEKIKEGTGFKTFNRGTVYDLMGRVQKETYPTGYFIQNFYDDYSNITKVIDAGGRVLWKVVSENARGQLTEAQKGGRTINYGFDSRGLPTNIQSGSIVNMEYKFDAKANLEYRIDHLTAHQREDFVYDELNRLTNWTVTRNSYQTPYGLVYNNNSGNIESKSDLGNFTMAYGEENGKPHALTSISGVPANFPQQTTTFPLADLAVTYTDFKKIKMLSEMGKTYELTYGVDDQRRKSVYTLNGQTKLTRYYLGDYEEEVDAVGNIRQIHYLSGAILIKETNKPDKLYYSYSDYQGSLIALTDKNGTVVERYAYDPWGARRNPTDWTQTDLRTSWIVNRGYTGHEHIDAFGIINMNGRVYDPLTAQFYSPDPYVQAPGDWLNYNRYTYAFGNPFKYTDPSGELQLGPFYASLNIGWSPNGGLSLGVSAGVGIEGWLYAGIGVNYGFKNSNWSFTGNVGAFGSYAYGGYDTKAGWIGGAGWAAPSPFAIWSPISINSNLWSAGVSYSQNEGWSTNVAGFTASSNGINFDPSIGASVNFKFGSTIHEELAETGDGDNSFKFPYENDEHLNNTIAEQLDVKKYGVQSISAFNEEARYEGGSYVRYKDGWLYKVPDNGGPEHKVRGVSIVKYRGWSNQTDIFLSRNSDMNTFHSTLNHELIHAYHYSLYLHHSMGKRFNSYTESVAYAYSVRTGTQNASVLNRYSTFYYPIILPPKLFKY